MDVGLRQTSTGALWPRGSDDPAPATFDELLLARISCSGGATRARARERSRTVYSTSCPRPTGAHRRAEMQRLVASRPRAREPQPSAPTEEGAAAVARFLGQKEAHARAWPELRDVGSSPRGCGLEKASRLARRRSRVRRAARAHCAEGLRACARQTQSPVRSCGPRSRVVALERAFGNTVKADLQQGSSLSAQGRARARRPAPAQPARVQHRRQARRRARRRAGRRRAPRAGDAAPRASCAGSRPKRAPHAGHRNPSSRAKMAARVARPAQASRPVALPCRSAPDLAQFSARRVKRGRTRAEGWPGSRKAFISQVWEAIRTASGVGSLRDRVQVHAGRGAPRGPACPRQRRSQGQAEHQGSRGSAVLYKNTVWHFVRVED